VFSLTIGHIQSPTETATYIQTNIGGQTKRIKNIQKKAQHKINVSPLLCKNGLYNNNHRQCMLLLFLWPFLLEQHWTGSTKTHLSTVAFCFSGYMDPSLIDFLLNSQRLIYVNGGLHYIIKNTSTTLLVVLYVVLQFLVAKGVQQLVTQCFSSWQRGCSWVLLVIWHRHIESEDQWQSEETRKLISSQTAAKVQASLVTSLASVWSVKPPTTPSLTPRPPAR